MSAPVTPAEVEAELARLADRLEQKSDDLAGVLEAAAKADVAYRLAYARALLRADGSTVAEREAVALIAVEAELWERKTTEAIADACKESVRSLRYQLSALQSICANTRYQAGLA